jgi:hypothetical protein
LWTCKLIKNVVKREVQDQFNWNENRLGRDEGAIIMKTKKHLLIVVLILLMTALACSIPGIPFSVKVDANQVGTAAAKTLAADPIQGIFTNTPFVFDPTSAFSPTITSTSTLTYTPTLTFTPTFTPTETLIPSDTASPTITFTVTGPQELCNIATFIGDITVPDGTDFHPGESFIKTWRLKNVGSCTWSTDYEVVFVDGNHMGGPADVNLLSTVAPGQTVDVSVPLVAPGAAGTYLGNWKLRDKDGVLFGLTTGKPFYVEIDVVP